jgi:tetratricopeptide (TPR) repeat protein
VTGQDRLQARLLLGKPAPFVGRDRELAALEALFAQCEAERAPRVALVTSAPGVGKSRLRHELLQRLQARACPPEIWIGRGDPVSAGSPFGLVAGALRRALGLAEGRPLGELRATLAGHVEALVPPGQRQRVTEFLGELVGVPFEDTHSQQLPAARGDAMLMGDQVRRAWEEFVAAVSSRRPLVLVFDDLQWGDLPSLKLIEGVLMQLIDRPLYVLGVGRPEVEERYPRLWRTLGRTHVVLHELPRRAGEELVRAVLPDADPTAVSRVVACARGNPFHLEELIRAVVEGRSDLPASVGTMTHWRLDGLEAEARRVLCAASVFGGACWLGGVTHVLLGEPVADAARHWLEVLVERELLSARPHSRIAGETEYVFRHILFREAAYQRLAPAERELAHQLAADWLERHGETDSILLAEHRDRGGQPEAAARWYLRASAEALAGYDFDAARERIARGGAGCKDPELLGQLRLVEAEVGRWHGDLARAEAAAGEAMELIPPGAPAWYRAAGLRGWVASLRENFGVVIEVGQMLAVAPGAPDAREAHLAACAQVASRLYLIGRQDLAGDLLARLDEWVSDGLTPSTLAWVYRARSFRAATQSDKSASLAEMEKSAAAFERIGDVRNATIQQLNAAENAMELGLHAHARTIVNAALDAAMRMGLHVTRTHALVLSAELAIDAGYPEDALGLPTDDPELFRAPRMKGWALMVRGHAARVLGQLDTAEALYRGAIEQLAGTPPMRGRAVAGLAETCLARGRVDEAMQHSLQAVANLSNFASVDGGEEQVRLTHIRVLEAAGQVRAAQAFAQASSDLLHANATRIGDPALRESYLHGVRANREILAHARRLTAKRS